jgi:hypothetical protein
MWVMLISAARGMIHVLKSPRRYQFGPIPDLDPAHERRRAFSIRPKDERLACDKPQLDPDNYGHDGLR